MSEQKPAGDDSSSMEAQLLLYAREIRELHQAERAGQQQLQAAQATLAETHAQQLAIIADLRQVYEAEQRAREELKEAYMATIRVLAAAVEAKDDYTGGHIERVRSFSRILAERMDFDARALQALDVGAILHDVGKVGVPDS